MQDKIGVWMKRVKEGERVVQTLRKLKRAKAKEALRSYERIGQR
jgi:hypothetical protein